MGLGTHALAAAYPIRSFDAFSLQIPKLGRAWCSALC